MNFIIKLVLLSFLAIGTAQAQSYCVWQWWGSSLDLSFSQIDPDEEGTAVTAPIKLACIPSATPPGTTIEPPVPGSVIKICVGISGNPYSAVPLKRHYLGQETDKLGIEFYSDAAHTQVWKSIAEGGVEWTFPLSSGVIDLGPIYAKIFPPKLDFLAGHTVADLLPDSLQIRAGITHPGSTTGCLDLSPVTAPPISLDVQWVPSCQLTTAPLDFGMVASSDFPVSSMATLNVKCSSGYDYFLTFNDGLNSLPPGKKALRLEDSSELIDYAIFADSARTKPLNMESSMGQPGYQAIQGSPYWQTMPLYGIAYAPDYPPPMGTYTDTVLIEIAY